MLRLLLIACCAAALVAGCGSGRSVQRQHLTTPAAFAAAANSVCARAKTRGTRLAWLHRLVPPRRERDLFDRWLKAEQSAVNAARKLREPEQAQEGDPLIPLVVAEGKVTGYARRLGADLCTRAPGGTMPS